MKILDDFPEIPKVPTTSMPRWITEEYDENLIDMMLDLYAVSFWGEVSKLKIKRGRHEESKPDSMSPFDWYTKIVQEDPTNINLVNARLTAQAYARAMQDSDRLQGMMERAKIFYLYNLKTYDRYRLLGEYDNLEEFLIDRLPHLAERDGERSNVMFLLNELIPLLKQIDNDYAQKLIVMQNNYSRMREAVPAFQRATKNLKSSVNAHKSEIEKRQKEIEKLGTKFAKAKTPEEKKVIEKESIKLQNEINELQEDTKVIEDNAIKEYSSTIDEIIETISNPSIPTGGPNGIRNYLKRKEIIIFKGDMAILKESSIFVVEVPSDYQQTIQNMLSTLVDFHITDPKKLPSIVGKILGKHMKGRKK